MSTTNASTENGIAIPRHATVFGTDREGREHAYSPLERTVYVSDGRSFDLSECPTSGLEDWIAHTEAVCGWREVRYESGGPTRGLARRLAGGLKE